MTSKHARVTVKTSKLDNMITSYLGCHHGTLEITITLREVGSTDRIEETVGKETIAQEDIILTLVQGEIDAGIREGEGDLRRDNRLTYRRT